MDAGLRGYRVGGAMISEKHCGFVVNVQDATARDAGADGACEKRSKSTVWSGIGTGSQVFGRISLKEESVCAL